MSNKTTVTAESGTPIIRIERIFDTSREKVFSAFTQKETLAKWWSLSDKVHIALDAREGGAWKFVDVTPDGQETMFYGFFHEITAPERIVQTAEFANVGERGHVVLERYEFNELDGGRTRMVLTEAFLSIQDRDAAIESGMEEGLAQSYIKLDSLLQAMK